MQKYIDILLENPTGAKLKLASFVFAQAIPFNIPHGFSFQKISAEEIKMKMDYIRKNKNHLGGMHACAIATLGEYCAGVLLLKNFGTQKYRYILSDLNIKYHYQGRMDLLGSAKIETTKIEELKQALTNQDTISQEVITEVHDTKANHVATITSTWQLKSWDKVKTK